MKTCTGCRIEKEESEFHRNASSHDGLQWKCKKCVSASNSKRKFDPIYKERHRFGMKKWRENNPGASREMQRKWRDENPEIILFRQARRRAKEKNIPFSISISDIEIPKICPVLGLYLQKNGHRDLWPSIDRINPSAGYIKGNVVVISYRANRIKNDATVEELRKIYEWTSRISNHPQHAGFFRMRETRQHQTEDT